MSRLRLASLVLSLSSFACSGDVGSVHIDAGPNDPDAMDPCDPSMANVAPAVPSILDPVVGRIDVIPGSMVISSSPFSDPDAGDTHIASAFELWSMANGNRVERVWAAAPSGDPTKLTRVTLADGQLFGSALANGGLYDWTDYSVRVRYRDSSDGCGTAWSEWSADLPFRTDDGSSYLFDPNAVRDVYLDIPPSSYTAMDAEAVPPGCVPYTRNYYAGTLTYEGQVFADVGLHVKGGCGSARHLNGKASFRVSIDWDNPALPGCPAERRLLGQKHLVLNNNVQDWSMIHERLGYGIYRQLGIGAPRAVHVRVHVNGEYWGVYTLVEAIDRRFLERWFESNQGMLYEGTYWCDLIPGNVPPGTDDSYCLTREFSPDLCSSPNPDADPEDYETLRTLVNQVQAMPPGGFYPEVKAFFDYDAFMTSWAIESYLSHWDAYEFSIMNNYRVYHDRGNGLWHLISTGIDQTFSGDQDPWGVSGILATKCTQEPDCNAAFAAKLAEVNAAIEAMPLAAQANAFYSQIAADVALDPRREQDTTSFSNAVSNTVGYIGTRPARIRDILAAHGF
jgi:hypothetical protein